MCVLMLLSCKLTWNGLSGERAGPRRLFGRDRVDLRWRQSRKLCPHSACDPMDSYYTHTHTDTHRERRAPLEGKKKTDRRGRRRVGETLKKLEEREIIDAVHRHATFFFKKEKCHF